jgi:16S rRNA (guanine527-N7)-methyltransferase
MYEDLRALGLDKLDLDTRSLAVFVRILGERTARDNLMGPQEMDRIWPRHVLESLCYALLLDPGKPVVDVGTGAGFPGLVLALAGFEVTMLEPRRKRYLFLRHVLRRLRMREDAVRRARVEEGEISGPKGLQFVCRAVGPPERLMRQIAEVTPMESVLVCRAGREDGSDSVQEQLILPSPPLDRRGVLLQYRIPENRPLGKDNSMEDQ